MLEVCRQEAQPAEIQRSENCHSNDITVQASAIALLLSFCLITAPSLLLQAGDVERNPGPEGTRVKEGALPELLNLLSPVVHSWKLFAFQIGVPSDQISQIEAVKSSTNPTSLYTCLTQVLEWWRANHDNPTYEVIISCLDPKPGGATPVMNRALASDLREFVAKQQDQGIPKNSGAGNDQLESSSSTVTLPRSPELSTFGQCEQTAEDSGEAYTTSERKKVCIALPDDSFIIAYTQMHSHTMHATHTHMHTHTPFHKLVAVKPPTHS